MLLSIGVYAQQPDSLATANDSLAQNEASNIPVVSLSASELQAEMDDQDLSSLLQASRDVFNSTAGYTFGNARYRIRGYDSELTPVYINGIYGNDFETGYATWYRWGGLNDITRYQNVETGISPNPFGFGGVGGYSNIEMRATAQRKGTRFSYALTNRVYRNRLMLTHSTGMMKNGWAVATSVSRRWSEEGYVPGTWYDAASYYLAIEKKVNDKHSFGLVGFGAPTVSARNGLATQEAMDLADNPYYNPNWGFQDGEKRNSRVRNTHQPMLILSHYYTPNDDVKLSTSAYYSFGKSGYTRINWYDAQDPRPDYYRYLPSYFRQENPSMYNQVLEQWQTNQAVRQIDWDRMYFANSKNLYTVEDAYGVEGNDITGNRSKYIVEDERDDINIIGGNSLVDYKISDKLTFNGGIAYHGYQSRQFKTVDDLMGGDFWLDVDQFAERDFADPSLAQSDLNNPNNVVFEGDVIGYDFEINVHRASTFGQLEYDLPKWKFYFGMQAAHTRFWRNGNMKKGLFPETSFGKSEEQSFFHGGAKAGATYKFSGRHFLSLNTMYITLAPEVRNSFLSSRTREDVIDGLELEKIMAADVNYILRFPKVKGRITAYYTQQNDQVWNRSFYHDELRTFVNYSMTNVDKLYMGAEIGLQYQPTSTITLTGVLGTGEYIYNSRPIATLTRDNSREILAKNRTVYIKNYRLGSMPQTAASFGFKYNSPDYWFFGVNGNFFSHMYLDPNPDRRTAEAIGNFVADDPQIDRLLEQERFDDQYTVDMFVGKSWRIKDKYYLSLTVNVSNVLDNREFKMGGYEQLRYDRTDVDRFPPKYAYLFGRNFYAMVSLRF